MSDAWVYMIPQAALAGGLHWIDWVWLGIGLAALCFFIWWIERWGRLD